MRVTLRDIAARAGVTKATVSYAMSGKPNVSEDMRARILDIANELGYQPNVTARALSVGRAPTLALMVENIANPFYPEFALALERAARERGHFLLICNTDADPEIGRTYLRRIAGQLSEGIVAMAGHLRIDDVVAVNQSGVPVVVCMWEEPEIAPPAPCVTVDFAHAAAIAAGHLLSLGHRRIGVLVDGDAHELHHQRRLEGFMRTVRAAGIDIDARHIVRAPDTIAGGTQAARALLAAAPSLTALFATNDLLALGALRAAHEMRIKIPEQLSVIGITDIRAASESYPALTSVAVQTREVAAHAIDLLLGLIDQTIPADPPPLIITPSASQLRVRESTAPPRKSRSRNSG
jgi:DNA-binding LacI/PurR family transcriptional regulator